MRTAFGCEAKATHAAGTLRVCREGRSQGLCPRAQPSEHPPQRPRRMRRRTHPGLRMRWLHSVSAICHPTLLRALDAPNDCCGPVWQPGCSSSVAAVLTSTRRPRRLALVTVGGLKDGLSRLWNRQTSKHRLHPAHSLGAQRPKPRPLDPFRDPTLAYPPALRSRATTTPPVPRIIQAQCLIRA